MAGIAQEKERYLRAPRLTASHGGATLHVIAWEARGERTLAFELDAFGSVIGEPQAGPWQEGIVAWNDGSPLRPSPDDTDELRCSHGAWTTWIEQRDGLASVWAQRNATAPVRVWRAYGMAAAPAVAATERGAWVAFHHDVREDTLERDVSKWIALRFVAENGEVHEPAAPMAGRDRDRHGVEQGFEFPALAVGEDGAVTLVGRGSHNFWRQDLNAEGFSPREPLSDGQWGSRGRRATVLRLNEGALLVAMRERREIAIQRLAGPKGGSPSLKPSEVDWTRRQHPIAVARFVSRDDLAARYGQRTLFGDIQQHSAHSDGVGGADEVYLRARDRYGDDFVALTDHESFLGKRTGPGEWRYLQQVADRYDEPGRFATLLAYEWTGKMYPGPGHKCVYYPHRDVPIVSRDDVPVGGELVRAVHTLGGFASPHHIGWTGCDEEGHDDAGQPLWEICSCHGCYEHVDHPLGQRGELRTHMADEMLRRGHRFGFTASSDSHGLLWHHGEARKRDPYRTGLTAVQATQHSRSAIMDALRARRCYATSGEKILLDFHAADAPMGSILEASAPLPFHAEALGTDTLACLQLVGPEGVVAETQGNGRKAELSGEHRAPWLYARAIQKNGEMAWSSPIFVSG